MLNFAIVGCGHIAEKHAQSISSTEGACLYAVCDTNRIQMQQFNEDYCAEMYTNIDIMLRDPSVDVVNICTPTGSHAMLAIKAANAGKHVIVEKPIALTLSDADAIIEACQRNGVKLAVVHPNRFRPAVLALKKALDEGLFGKLSHVNATVRWNRDQAYYNQALWRGTKAMDGGVLMNQAIHNLDLLQWLIGPLQEVQAFTTTRLRNIEAEDVAVAVVQFQEGVLGVIEAATTVYPKNYEESISIFGETGSAVIGGSTGNWIKHWTFKGVTQEESEQLMKDIQQNPFGIPGHQHIVADMIEAVRDNRSPVVSGEDGKKALQFVLEIYGAAEQSSKPLLEERMMINQ
jgi:UDP-N-acetyl-2-amino-2-deoxyglucuronate dehydrogenase